METQIQEGGILAIKKFLTSEGVTAKFQELLGKKSAGFITSVMQLCNQSKNLANCNPAQVYQAAAMAAMLDLPLNPNLGFAYIIPYNETQTNDKGQTIQVPVPQFQMGYRGFIQLAQRSGQFQTINVTDVREGEIKSQNRMTGDIVFEWTDEGREEKKIIGFVGYFRLINGFEKVVYRTVGELNAHGKKYSKTYSKSSSKWKTDFEAMSQKTLIKLMLSKYAPLSIEMQTATLADQAVINKIEGGIETAEFSYIDNEEGMNEVDEILLEDIQTLFDLKKHALTADEITNAERILKNKEENSYGKLQTMLQSK